MAILIIYIGFLKNTMANYRKNLLIILKRLKNCRFWTLVNKRSYQMNTLEYKNDSNIFVLLTWLGARWCLGFAKWS